jgi:hypothetical protein
MGFDVVDEHLMNIVNNLNLFFQKYYTGFISAGQALGAVLSIFVIAGEAYKVMLQKQGFDVLAIMRPVAFAMIIALWIPFTTALAAVPKLMETYAQSIFDKEQTEVKLLRETRTKEAYKVRERVREAKAAADLAQKQITDGSNWDKLVEMGSDFLDTIKEQLASFGTIFQAHVNQILEEWVLKLGQFFWQIAVYLLFFIKETFAGILIITGPLTFGLSVIPAWKDAWSQWIARYISVLLYGFVGYIVLAAAMQLVKYGIEYDIKVLMNANSNSQAFASYSDSSVITAIFHFVTLMVGAAAIKMVPELSTWIIPSSTAHAASHFTTGVTNQITNAGKTAINLATGGK